MSNRIFVEAIFIASTFSSTRQDDVGWQDRSTVSHHIFESSFGSVSLRKRTSYPQTFATFEGSQLHIGYGDGSLARAVANTPLGDVPETCFYDDEFFYVYADCVAQQVRIQCDAYNTLLCFIGQRNERLAITNVFERTVELLDSDQLRLDEFALAEILTNRESHERTLVKEVTKLYDRARLVWSRKGGVIEYPPDGSVAYIKDHDGEPIEFGERLEETIERYWERYSSETTPGFTLSYGLDSSIVAGYLADKQIKGHYVTAGYPSAFGESQQQKADLFRERYGIESQIFQMDPATDYPFSLRVQNGDWQPFYHRQELYDVTFEKMVGHLARHNVTAMFMGIGGDELGENIPKRHMAVGEGGPMSGPLPRFLTVGYRQILHTRLPVPQTSKRPIPLLAHSVAMHYPNGNNIFLQHNIWPVIPLADARLYAYCQSLPIRYRHNKNILRAYAKARQMPIQIAHPTANENFGPFLEESILKHMRPLFEYFLNNSSLERLGLLDIKAFWKIYGELGRAIDEHTANERHPLVFAMYSLLLTEINLRSLFPHITPAQLKVLQ
ncbi:MAG: asparagine synthase-related protein [Patescibacteria group bacterium]